MATNTSPIMVGEAGQRAQTVFPSEKSIRRAQKEARKAEKSRDTARLIGACIIIILIALAYQSLQSLRRISSSPTKAFCEVISSQDRYYFCEKSGAHAECQVSLVTFNFSLEGKTLVRIEEIIFRPRLSQPLSGKIECYYRPGEMETSLFLVRDAVPSYHGLEAFYLISLILLTIATIIVIAFVVDPTCSSK